MGDQSTTVQFPMSFAQKRLWFLNELDPDAPFYNIPANLRLKGRLDVDALKGAICDLVDRHEILRTTFHMDKGQPVQCVHDHLEIPMVILDGQDQGDWLETRVRNEVQTGFDLSNGPLLRFSLIRFDDEDHALLCTMHHIVSDGWSMGGLIREVSYFYDCRVSGKAADLPALDIQYGDFSDWQNDWLQGDVLAKQTDYWKQQLSGASAILDLPLDRERPKQRGWQASSVALEFDDDLYARLQSFCTQNGVTPYMVCWAALSVLLAKYCREDDIVVGSPIANRNRSELENLIGFFVNTLVLRLDLADNPSFTDLVQVARKTALDGFAHQDVPFEHLVEALAPARHLNVNPLFQVSYSFQNAPQGEMELDGLSVAPLSHIQTGMGRFDLEFSFWEDGALFGGILFKKDIFDQATIERMARHFTVLFKNLLSMPAQRISEISMMQAEETKEVLSLGAKDFAKDTAPELVHHRFEKFAQNNPDKIALRFEGEQLTYGELNERSNRLARVLNAKGVGAESLVGVYLERSLETVVAILAVLKSGGGYLPLEPAYQSDRLAFMIEDSAVGIIITHSALKEKLSQLVNGQDGLDFLCLDQFEDESRVVTPSSAPVLEDRAYVIYTSGSTGKPKGVEITHHNLSRLFTTTEKLFDFGSDDVWTMFHSHAFDFSVWEIWGALAYGGTLVVVPYWTTRSPDSFYDLLVSEKVTVLNQTPSAFYSLIQMDEARQVQGELSLRYVIFGGEALDFRKLKSWYARHDDQAPLLVNMYGITETTVHASFRPLAFEDAQGARSLIGMPLPDLYFYLLDPYGQPVPVGVKGEIHVGGSGVGRGYFNRPDLTAQRFIADERALDGGTLYRSGDLARWLPDGALEYCGRMDDQIQIRGFRVELGEIQSLLCEHDRVRDCIVLCISSENGPEIVAYCVSNNGETPDLAALRSFLKEKLPDYMVPARLFAVKDIPLTAHGKVDRAKLQTMDCIGEANMRVLPENPTQKKLFQIWVDVLGHDNFGVQDNFFEIGGHSLLATQVIMRLRQHFEDAPTLRTFFENPRINEIAAGLKVEASDNQPKQPVITPRPANCRIPLSFAQERLWFIQTLEGENAAYNVPNVYRLNGDLNCEALEKALNHLIARHEILRTNFLEKEGKPYQLVHGERPITLVSEDARNWTQDCVKQAVTACIQQPFNLDEGPLLRVKVLRLGQENHILILSIHHIIFDGWSSALLVSEVMSAYDAFCAGKDVTLEKLPVQYGDFAYWQRRRFNGDEGLARQVEYWRGKLDGVAPVLEMACQKPRPPVQSYRGKLHHFTLDQNLRYGVERIAKEGGASSFMTMLAAFGLLVSRYSLRDDLVIGTPIANREYRELEKLIGFFTNTLALRLDLGGKPDFMSLLARVRETVLDGFTHQDIPFEKLVGELSLERSLSHAPLFQIMFVMQNEQGNLTALNSDLQITNEPFDFESSRFDMVFYVSERDGGYKATIEYATDLFDDDVVSHMGDAFDCLLSAIVENPKAAIDQYRLSNTVQLAPQISEPALNVVTRFEDMVERKPDACALVFEEYSLSFREVNQQANRMAHWLIEQNIGEAAIIGLMMVRSEKLPVSLLAILKAGAAYLPIDPAYPPERICDMLEDSGCKLVLCDGGSLLPERLLDVTQIDVTALLSAEIEGDILNPSCDRKAQSSAYVLYTSGSTGKPKGVVMGHGCLANLIDWQLKDEGLGRSARVLHFAPFTFDVSFQEVFTTWCSGGSLYLVGNDQRRDFHSLVHYVDEQKIERVFMPYVALQQFASVAQELQVYPHGLRDMITAGEQLRITPAIKALFGHLIDARLHNHYGPSETHVVTSEILTGNPQTWPLLPAIGYPIDNAFVELLDPAQNPVPVGGPAEIYVGGLAVANGYLGRDDLTQEKFVTVSLEGGRAHRMYRTGDLAIRTSGGKLIYLGRGDTQVKIRGFRIEPGEVETVLNALAGVRECCVVACEINDQAKQLVAYVCLDDQTCKVSDLRQSLKEKLPEYMVPAHFMVLDDMPVTGSGKIDRKQLPPVHGEQGIVDVINQPQSGNPIEEILQSIWTTVLGCVSLSRQDNFFEVGGHSLLATQMVSRIRDSFACEFSVRQIFENPVFVDLLTELEASLDKSANSQSKKIVARDPNTVIPASFAQERLWFLDRLQGQTANYNMSAAIQIEGTLDVDAFAKAIRQIQKRHEVLRSNFSFEGEVLSSVVRPACEEVFSLFDLSDMEAEERNQTCKELIVANAVSTFDLGKDLLFSVQLICQEKDRNYLMLLRMHHIVADNWSTGIFLKELSSLYHAYSRNEPQQTLPDLDIQYGDFAIWQRGWLETEGYKKSLQYWQERLQGVNPVLDLSGKVEVERGVAPCLKYGFSLETDLSQAFSEFCRAHGVSLYMGMMAAYGCLLHKQSGVGDFVIGSPIANRNHREIEGLIGFFVNTMPIRFTFENSQTFEDVLIALKRDTLDAYRHQDVPFEHIVRAACQDRDQTRAPLVQNVFVLQNAAEEQELSEGLKMEILPSPNGAAKFDLVCSISGTQDNLKGVLEYDSALFDSGEIEAFAQCYLQLLQQICEDPKTIISLGREEKQAEEDEASFTF